MRQLIGEEMRARGETLRSLAPRTGHTYNWLWYRLSGKTQITLSDVTILAHILDQDMPHLIAKASKIADGELAEDSARLSDRVAVS